MKTQKLAETAIGRIPGELKIRVDKVLNSEPLGPNFTCTTLGCTLLETQNDGTLKEHKTVELPTGKFNEIEVDDQMIITNAYIGREGKDGRRWIVMPGAGLNLPDNVGRI